MTELDKKIDKIFEKWFEMKGRLIIELTDLEQVKIRDYAERLVMFKESNKECTNMVVDKTKDPVDILTTGLCAEHAVCKHLGVPHDLNDIHIGGDKYDISYNGRKLEVKMVWHYEHSPELRISTRLINKEFDVAVLAKQIYYNKTFEILGWIWKNDYILKSTVEQRKYSEMHVLGCNQLEDPFFLKSI